MRFLLFIILIAVVTILIIAMRRPNHFRIERQIKIDASSEVVFTYINDFRRWTAWSPWENIDPNLQRTYSGADTGVDAHMVGQ